MEIVKKFLKGGKSIMSPKEAATLTNKWRVTLDHLDDLATSFHTSESVFNAMQKRESLTEITKVKNKLDAVRKEMLKLHDEITKL